MGLCIRGILNMENSKKGKLSKRYMHYCVSCGYLSFEGERCEECGCENMIETPKRFGLTNIACISMSVMDFEAMKHDFLREAGCRIS